MRFAVLYVDDEEKSLKYFSRTFRTSFRILTASNVEQGMQLLEEHKDDIGLLMTDQRMPGEMGIRLLERARQLRPRIVRILVTAYSDLSAAIEAVNNGAIYRYVTKPWDVPQLEATLRRALEFFIVQRERDQLLKEKLNVLQNLMVADRMASLGVLAAGLGHHMRNALVPIRTFVELAPMKLKEEKRAGSGELGNASFWVEFHQQVLEQVHRITDLLSYLGIASESSAPVFHDELNLSKFVEGLIEGLRTETQDRRIRIENKLPATLPVITADAVKLRRLFLLLLQEEIVSLPEASRIVIDGRALPAENGSGPRLQVEIHDNGPGMPENALRSLFDPFFQRQDDPQEFGLRLMTCYFLAARQGGRIEARSHAGSGVTFVLTLPVRPEPIRAKSEPKDLMDRFMATEVAWEQLLTGRPL
jgi:two-component system probable response regulator PhcQ